MKVVVVESPAKAKTINKYLGKDYHVIASFGHVRDVPAKNGSVRPDDNFAMDWELDERGEKHMREIAKLAKDADSIVLATDPDREGEAIAWHVFDILKSRLKKMPPVERVVFHEITKTAIINAIQNPRKLNQELIDAYLARRALDYLVGFTLSPVLWRKLPGSRSAGRVQSVALRLICDREDEIDRFKTQEYWTLEASFAAQSGKTFKAKLTHLNAEKLDKFSIANEMSATAALNAVKDLNYLVDTVEKKQVKRHPSAPFTTSTMQQEASRKLGFSASKTMMIAQRLYEGVDVGGETIGLITYMRTDSVSVSNEALTASRQQIETQFGKNYLPDAPRTFKSKAKNAQEAHEAIRPTNLNLTPDKLANTLDKDQLRLYELIWKRMMASQMASALLDQVSVDIKDENKKHNWRATGSTIAFDGFLTLYEEGVDDQNDDDDSKMLPPLKTDDALATKEIKPEQHFTQPPPRYSEASLVKKMEELGIGRPSTYASIIQVLQNRKYVVLDKKQFHPEDRGRIVTAFLKNYFLRYVEFDFTANLEDQLDEISNGTRIWKDVLSQFWDAFNQAINNTKDLSITQVLDTLDRELGNLFFPAQDEQTREKARECPSCQKGRLSLKLGRFGAFISCSNYPECNYKRNISQDNENGSDEQNNASTFTTRNLGVDPKENKEVTVRKGPYGFYLQWGELEGKQKPKRLALPKSMSPESITLDDILGIVALPRELGKHPTLNEMVSVNNGRFGPYVKVGSKFTSLGKDDDVYTITFERALELSDNDKKQPKEKKEKVAPKKSTKGKK